ncbi:AMP-dependent synthetase and ligase [Phenylobacterium zucineum HLK1]|uniref:AMP-dependent synthetase and ligase n=1 Tax=Phenylobacterium zucineum (strain HLK1) TaxID=450851 RepID=B4RGM2_PHEZH|nr:feruloyl-CoA synthase [Phenylobacterium zucineum]ACG78928.1 AMP-dependent synthetase and ligase [Phenylobacterium zucineum HLK1]
MPNRLDAPAYRPLPIRKPNVTCQARPDGSYILEQNYEMPEPWRSIPHLFQARAQAFPDRPMVAKREPLAGGGWGEWRKITFGEALTQSRALAQALLDLGAGQDAGVMVLSGPSIEHAVISLAAQMARAPFAPVSSGYSLVAGDFSRLQHVFATCRPKIVFADDGPAFSRALKALPLDGVKVITVTPSDVPSLSYAELIATPPTAAVDASIAAITPDTFAKTIFTSGSTGRPKGVIQTQRMLTAIIAQHDALYIRDEEDEAPGAYLSWLPWSHVGGTNVLFGDVINDGACLYIDEGRPVAGQFDETLRNLREIQPREYGSTPIFFSHLVAAMEADAALRDHFFGRLRYLNYSTAGLSQDLFERLQALSIAATGQRIPISTKYGSTETQGVTIVSEPLDYTGPIGLPFPGITVKLAPVGDKLEIRAKGDTVTPGYLGDPEATAKAFDEEGFYRTGDAARFVDPENPSRGLIFDGRVTENFKLATGTWVSVGPLRLALIEALSPVLEDAVIAGENRDEICVLAWVRRVEAAAVAGLGRDASLAEICRAPKLSAFIRERLAQHNETAGGSSRRVARLLLLDAPATGDEIAEKGYINQRAVLRNRAAQVEALYAAERGPDLIIAPELTA